MKGPLLLLSAVQANTEGRLDDRLQGQILATLRKYPGVPLDIEIRKHKKTRSLPANAYYHGVVVKLLAEHCGYDHDDMHDALAMKFLRIEDCHVTGAPRRKRTPACDTKEFAEYVDACIRLAAELGVVIPDPSQVAA